MGGEVCVQLGADESALIDDNPAVHDGGASRRWSAAEPAFDRVADHAGEQWTLE